MRQGRLAAVVLLVFEALTLAALGASLYINSRSGTPGLPPGTGQTVALAVFWLIIYLINRLGLTALAGVALALILLQVDMTILVGTGPLTPNTAILVVPIIIAGLFGPPVSAFIVAAIAGGAYVWLNLQANPAYFAEILQGGPALQTGLVYFSLIFVAVVSWLLARTTRHAVKESEELSLALVSQREDLMGQLEIQTQRLQAVITVARAVAGKRDLDSLLQDVVRLMREMFGYYHVQVYLTDEEGIYAVLQESSGEAGQKLLMRGHRLPIGSLSVVGQATAGGQPVIAHDTETDPVYRPNELLPETRSEMALPLQVGDEIIGALDLQSREPDAFSEDVIPTLQALADQIAVAIQNARLFEQAEENLRELRELSHDVTKRSWAEFLAESRLEEFRQVYGPEPKALQVYRNRVIRQVLNSGTVAFSDGRDGQQSFLAAPIVIRDEIIGVLGTEPGGEREWTQEDIQLIQAIAERTALAVENARLYIQSRRAAEREHLINTISTRLQRAPSLRLLLESVTQELAEALGTENVYAEISVGNENEPASPPEADRAEPETVDAEAKPDEDSTTPDEQEEARAEG